MNKGAKAKFYIPSKLGYGPYGQGDKIKADAILMFDVEVVDIISKEKARADEKQKMEEFKLKQKAFNDSMTKAHPKADTSHKAH
ncbi:MAG: FKBP-type peptidyl-prolyl cis-trans isomerase [Ferruginibacter sp.]